MIAVTANSIRGNKMPRNLNPSYNICRDPATAMVLFAVAGAGLKVASSVSKYKSSKRQAKAVQEEGKIKAKQRSRSALKLASQQKSSFLHSGIALTGDEGTTGSLIGETYDEGLEDINLIKSNYGNRAKSILSKGRSDLIGGLGSAALQLAGGMANAGMMGGGGTPAVAGQGGYGAATPAGSTNMGTWTKFPT